MSDWKLHENAYHEWKRDAADDYVAAQRRAFLDGFETAAKESEEFGLLRNWLEERRDEFGRRYDERGDVDDLGQKLAYQSVLVKLSEIGCRPGDNDE